MEPVCLPSRKPSFLVEFKFITSKELKRAEMSFSRTGHIWRMAVAWSLALLFLLAIAMPALADTVGRATTSNVNIRSGPGTAYNVIGTANKNDSFVVLNRQDDWYVIRYQGGVLGYISALYLSVMQDNHLPATVQPITGNVNIRSGPGTDQVLLGTFSGSTTLAVSGESGYWYAVSYNGKTGYVAKWLVTADYNAAAAPAPPPAGSSVYAPAVVTSDTLNLRDAPEGQIIAKLDSNTRLYVMDNQNGWYKVQSPAGVGWVHGDYISFDQSQTSSQALPDAAIPSFGGQDKQGTISLEWQEESYGYQLTLSGDTLIRYTVEETERGYSIVTDMEIQGGVPQAGSLGMQIYLEGAFHNTLTINGSDVLYCNLSEEDFGNRLILSVGLSPVIGRLIYIDPGHGSINDNDQIDTGAMAGDLVEKDLTYDIAQQMQRILSDKGAQVLLSRGETTDLTLENRAYPANDAGADILVSVHVNAAANANSSGSSTWFFAPVGDDAYDREASSQLAACIQSALLAATGFSDYGIREANFAVLRASNMPAVLVEAGFITNAGDAAKLADSNFRKLVAEAIANGIIEYFRLAAD